MKKPILLLYWKQSTETLVPLLNESANLAVLYSACTSEEAGRTWMNCYLDS